MRNVGGIMISILNQSEKPVLLGKSNPMWILTIRFPSSSPVEYKIKPGKNTLGRKRDNDIVIVDESASRMHAEFYCEGNRLVIYDLKSTNGTFLNRERINEPHVLRAGDQIRIGQHEVIVSYRDDNVTAGLISALSGTQPLTRELLLESVDQHAVLLYEVASRLATIIDLKTALQEVSHLMQISMGAEKCEVILAEQFNQLSDLGFPTSIAQQAIEQHSVVIIPDLESQADHPPSKSTLLLHIRSVLCVPVIIEGDVAALIYVYKTDPVARPFDQHDVQLAVAISNQTSLIIQRANLLERSRILEQKANIDNLTGLYNRNHFFNLSEREFRRAQRFRHPLTIIMLDFDQLKQVNDTFGHIVGDQVLQEVAVRSKKQIRENDLIGRFGGDEFIILLVEIDSDRGLKVAERIRQVITTVPINTERGALNITVSMGIATLNDECPNLAALIDNADNAMYAAKKAGKNQVEVS
jgi:diguanylate cyclase (GGDEF)-like protein